jgi:hypothetical protein
VSDRLDGKCLPMITGMTDADLEEYLLLVRENRRRKLERNAEDAQALASELAELVSRGETPALGLWRRHGVRPKPAPDMLAWIAADESRTAAAAREAVRLARTIPLRDALAALADDLLASGADPQRVEEAFASVIDHRRAA